MNVTYIKCDMCGKIMDTDARHGIFIGANWQSSEQFDFCPECSEQVQGFIAGYRHESGLPHCNVLELE